jgi:beta-lactamase superfamily II metal-dependent hydrolase
MVIFEAIDAAHGDAILVRYQGTSGFQRIILVDAGPKSANDEKGNAYVPYEKRVIPRLMEIKEERDEKPAAEDIRAGEATLAVDLVVCTHIDDDHIAGVERLYGCLSSNAQCADDGEKVEARTLWFNSFSKLMGKVSIDDAVVQQLSVTQGEHLTSFAQATKATINQGAPGQLVAAGQLPKGFAPATVTITNPDGKALEKLKKTWLADVKKKGKKKAAAEPSATGGEVKFRADTAAANLSSIVMLIEVFGRRILLTGDQRGDHVLEGLIKTRKAKGGKLHVDILKVPHHGAIGNNPKEFVAAVTADTYVFSANGKDQNPDPPVLALYAAEAKKNRRFTMAFTNGALVYEKDKKGKLPAIGKTTVKTLKDAIAELKKDPDVKKNVTFLFRDPKEHSLVFELEKKA